jgi:hypothetical protein
LQALLTRYAVTLPGVFLYYPDKRQVLPKLRAFVDHVKRWVAEVSRDTATAPEMRKISAGDA